MYGTISTTVKPDALTKWWSSNVEPYETEIVCYSAGFLTASLIFSFVCVVSRCKRTPRKNNDTKKETQSTLNQSTASLNIQENGNEGSCDSDLKSYACVNLNKPNDNTDDMTAPIKSTKGYKRESYDIINHIPGNPTDVKLISLNPYSHVTADMETVEYDMTSYIKPRSDTKDPTYSHLLDVRRATEDLSGTTKTCDTTPVLRCRLEKEMNTSYKNKHGSKVIEKKLKSGNLIHEYKTTENNTKVNDSDNVENEATSQGHSEDCVNRVQEDQDADTKIRRNKHGYSVVKKTQRSTAITRDEDKKSVIVVDQGDDDVAVSDSVSSDQSIEDITSVEANEEETRCLLDSDMTSSQSLSETESGSDCPLNQIHEPMLAINALYEDFELENEEESVDLRDKSFEDIKMELTDCLKDS